MQEKCIHGEDDFILFINDDKNRMINIQTKRFVSNKQKDGTLKTLGFTTIENRFNRFPDIFYSVIISNNVRSKTFNHILKFTSKEYYDYVIAYLLELKERLQAKTA